MLTGFSSVCNVRVCVCLFMWMCVNVCCYLLDQRKKKKKRVRFKQQGLRRVTGRGRLKWEIILCKETEFPLACFLSHRSFLLPPFYPSCEQHSLCVFQVCVIACVLPLCVCVCVCVFVKTLSQWTCPSYTATQTHTHTHTRALMCFDALTPKKKKKKDKTTTTHKQNVASCDSFQQTSLSLFLWT